jgi:cytoskeletal protein CcmA (bactofilin family)
MNNPAVRGNLFIGQGVIANGTIAVPGEAIIDGEMSGKIDAGKIIVGKTGKLTADAVANYVDVSGEVVQKTVANISLSIQSGGVVSGEISYGDLEIMKGGEIMGTITQAKK